MRGWWSVKVFQHRRLDKNHTQHFFFLVWHFSEEIVRLWFLFNIKLTFSYHQTETDTNTWNVDASRPMRTKRSFAGDSHIPYILL